MRQISISLFLLSNMFAILLLSSCKTLTNVTALEIPVKFTDTELESSSVLTQQVYIKLKSTDQSSIVGNISRLLCADSLLFIIDSNNNKIVSFDYDGNFVNSTSGNIGHAQNEYIHLTDAAIDDANKEIYLYCDIPYQMLILDYNLEVKECVPMNDLLLEIAVDSEYLYALYPDLTDGSKFDVRCYPKDDLAGKPEILIKQDKAIPNVLGMGKMLCRNGKFIYTSLPFDSNIYKITDGQIIQAWSLNLGDRWFEYSESKDLRGREFFSANGDKNWIIQNIASSEKEMIFNTNKTTVFKLSLETSKCDGFLRFINESIPFSDSWFISTSGIYDVSFAIPASLIVDYNKYYLDRKEPLPNSILNSIIQSTTLEDNPVIVLANLK